MLRESYRSRCYLHSLPLRAGVWAHLRCLSSGRWFRAAQQPASSSGLNCDRGVTIRARMAIAQRRFGSGRTVGRASRLGLANHSATPPGVAWRSYATVRRPLPPAPEGWTDQGIRGVKDAPNRPAAFESALTAGQEGPGPTPLSLPGRGRHGFFLGACTRP